MTSFRFHDEPQRMTTCKDQQATVEERLDAIERHLRAGNEKDQEQEEPKDLASRLEAIEQRLAKLEGSKDSVWPSSPPFSSGYQDRRPTTPIGIMNANNRKFWEDHKQ